MTTVGVKGLKLSSSDNHRNFSRCW